MINKLFKVLFAFQFLISVDASSDQLTGCQKPSGSMYFYRNQTLPVQVQGSDREADEEDIREALECQGEADKSRVRLSADAYNNELYCLEKEGGGEICYFNQGTNPYAMPGEN